MEKYKYMRVKELIELGVFKYSGSVLRGYLGRPEFDKFRKEVGMRGTAYLFCPEFMRTWREFKDNLKEGRKIRHDHSLNGWKKIKV